MAIYTSDGSTFTFVTGSNTWATTANIYDDNTTTVGSLTTTSAGSHSFDIGSYGFAASIAAGDTVLNSVTLSVYQYVSQTARWNSPTVEVYDGATLIQQFANTNFTNTTTTTNVQTVTITGITLTQLKSANFKVRFIASKNGTQSATQNVASLLVTADVSSAVTSTESWGFLSIS